jgi:hypothetical protein
VTDDASEIPAIDSTVPHSARIWTYWLGGKDHYAVDREAGDRVRETFPAIADLARIGRYFLGRVVTYMAEDAGVRQFLDVGTGLPTVDNTHEVAQRIAPEARIVYVDNDPLVLAHANALLTSTSSGATSYINADVRDPDAILDRAAGTLDFSRPVGLILMGVLAHVADYEEARAIVRSLLAALPPGSFLAVRDGADTDPDYREAIRGYNASGAVPYHLRSPEQIASFLDGLELVEPGVVPCPAWRPEVSPLGAADDVALLGGVGRKA